MSDTLDEVNWIKVSFWAFGFLIYFLLMKKFYPDGRYFFPYSIVHILGILWFMSIGKSILWRSRYSSYHVCVDGIHGSIFGKPEYVPDPSVGKGFHWAIFNLGFSLFPPLRGKLATLVVPADQIFPAGKNFVGTTLVRRWQFDLLPHVVSSYLRDNSSDFNVDKIYFGKYSRYFVDNSGKELDLNTQIQAKDSLITSLRKTIEHDFAHYEQLKNMMDKVSGHKNVFRRILEKAKSDEEE